MEADAKMLNRSSTTAYFIIKQYFRPICIWTYTIEYKKHNAIKSCIQKKSLIQPLF